jgi:hypothetical protein
VTTYPSNLPSPQIADYQVNVFSGVSSVTFEAGNTRQRRSARQERYAFRLSVVLSKSELWSWQAWANTYGYDWHYLDLISNFSGFTTDIAIPHYVRYTSDIQIQPLGADYFMASFDAEMDLSTLPLGLVQQTGDVIIGGTPASPSNSDSIQAGTPASPSTDFIIAGQPGLTA